VTTAERTAIANFVSAQVKQQELEGYAARLVAVQEALLPRDLSGCHCSRRLSCTSRAKSWAGIGSAP
jgi:hypothetical protein